MADHPPAPRLWAVHAGADRDLYEEFAEHLDGMSQAGFFQSVTTLRVPKVNAAVSTIDMNLEAADLVIVMVSASLLASPWVRSAEILRAIEMHETGQIALLPLVARACDWDPAPFGGMRSLPEEGGAARSWAQRDEAWAASARSLRTLIREMGMGPEAPLVKSGTRGTWAGAPTTPGAKAPQAMRRGKRVLATDRPRPGGLTRQAQWVLDFLDTWSSWPFTEARIIQWGAKQEGHEILQDLSDGELRVALDLLAQREAVNVALAPRSRRKTWQSQA